MGLNLKIENEARLPDGGPLTYSLTGTRGADIGRDAHLDWTLPDPNRQISGKHCEIRFRDGGYWLHDVSRNGTFLNGSEGRIQSPHRIRSGDRLMIGHYIVAAEVTGESAAEPDDLPAPVGLREEDDLWSVPDGAAAPIHKSELRPPHESVPVRPDWLEWAVDAPAPSEHGFALRPAAAPAAAGPPAPAPAADPQWSRDWDVGPPPLKPEPEPPAPVPTPRRSIWVSQRPAGPWDGEEVSPEPPPVRPQASVAAPPLAPPNAAGQADADILARFARGAGMSPATIETRDAGDLAERLGRLMLLVTQNVKQLLAARNQTKVFARSANPTMIAALDNNPLKFSPTAADALKVMLGPPTASYLDAESALQQSFDDLKSHQIKTFAAMQHALAMLIEDLDPKAIESGLGEPKGVLAQLGGRRARLWTTYEARWQAKTRRQAGGMQDLFMQYFAECYDRSAGPGPERGGVDRS